MKDFIRAEITESLRRGAQTLIIYSGGQDPAEYIDVAASAALCRDRIEKRPCGVCPDCRKIARGIHPDVWRRDAVKQKITVEDARQVKRDSFILPNDSEKKTYIITSAEGLKKDVQNVLLKTLEEPPRHTVFILEAGYREQLLETVNSRGICVSLCVGGETDLAVLPGEKEAAGKAEAKIRDLANSLVDIVSREARLTTGGELELLELAQRCDRDRLEREDVRLMLEAAEIGLASLTRMEAVSGRKERERLTRLREISGILGEYVKMAETNAQPVQLLYSLAAEWAVESEVSVSKKR